MNGYYTNGRRAESSKSDHAQETPRRHIPSVGSNSGLDQLRRNLHDAQLRESIHRPYFPSPLSQSPLQASISSASHTAASVASSSRTTVSTSTTPPSTSSRFSINQPSVLLLTMTSTSSIDSSRPCPRMLPTSRSSKRHTQLTWPTSSIADIPKQVLLMVLLKSIGTLTCGRYCSASSG